MSMLKVIANSRSRTPEAVDAARVSEANGAIWAGLVAQLARVGYVIASPRYKYGRQADLAYYAQNTLGVPSEVVDSMDEPSLFRLVKEAIEASDPHLEVTVASDGDILALPRGFAEDAAWLIGG